MRLLVNTAELRHAVGSEKSIEGEVDPAEIGIDDDAPRGRVADHVDLQLESVNDGVIVTGTVVGQLVGRVPALPRTRRRSQRSQRSTSATSTR